MNEIRDAAIQAFGHGQTWTGAALVILAPVLYILAHCIMGPVDNVLAGLIGAVSAMGAQMIGGGVAGKIYREKTPEAK
jgi:hypothetical protein